LTRFLFSAVFSAVCGGGVGTQCFYETSKKDLFCAFATPQNDKENPGNAQVMSYRRGCQDVRFSIVFLGTA
jgi:hypothetical protein